MPAHIRVAGGLTNEPVEVGQIQSGRGERELITGGMCAQRAGSDIGLAKQATQRGNVGLHFWHGRCRWPRAPQHLYQSIHHHQPACFQHKSGKQRALFGWRSYHATGPNNLGMPQYLDPDTLLIT